MTILEFFLYCFIFVGCAAGMLGGAVWLLLDLIERAKKK